MHLRPEELSRDVITLDEAGKVFFYQNRIFRFIYNSAEARVRKLLASGLIDELVREKLFPETTITDEVTVEGCSLVLEHERIPYVTLPAEWSFGMLKEAALTFLKVGQICQSYGYSFQDGHLHNMAFNCGKAVFMDLGSIREGIDFSCLAEFLEHAVIPLKVWGRGDFYLANLILRDIASYGRFLPGKPLAFHSCLRNLVPFFEREWPNFLRRAINYVGKIFSGRNILADNSMTFRQIENTVMAVKKKKMHSYWDDYHDPYLSAGIETTPRFSRIVEVLNGLEIDSMIDLAGNKGVFSFSVSRGTKIKKILCTDYDENAVDSLFSLVKKSGDEKITPMLLNFALPVEEYFYPLFQRVKSDIAVALAVLHHLVLTQKIPLPYILKTIGKYSSRYVLIEFMPLGLWNGEKAPPVPEWYSVEWFRESFLKDFVLLIEEQTEENRIFFLGEKRDR